MRRLQELVRRGLGAARGGAAARARALASLLSVVLAGLAPAATPTPFADIARLCAPLLPGPPVPASACRVEPIARGNTNTLYSLCRPEVGDRYLVRCFGTQAALQFDRARENRVFARLAAAGLAPPLVATFDGGRIEGWLDGEPCTAAECRSPAVHSLVARALASLHAFQLEDAEAASEPWALTAADAWLAGARRCVGALEARGAPALARRAARLDLDHVEQQLEACREQLAESAPPRCYCHNDLSNTNVLWHAPTSSVRLIDFEFGGLNFRGFDVGTHLSHWAGGALDGLYDDGAFPRGEEQRRFLRAYASAAGGADAEGLAAELRAALPLVHCVWGLWALCALPAAVGAAAPGGFSHIEYAERRLRAFEVALKAP